MIRPPSYSALCPLLGLLLCAALAAGPLFLRPQVPGPGGPIQFARRAAVSTPTPPGPSAPSDGLIAEYLPQNYATGAAGVDAVWTDSSGAGNNATQSVHADKPSYVDGALVGAGGANHLVAPHAIADYTNVGTVTVVVKSHFNRTRFNDIFSFGSGAGQRWRAFTYTDSVFRDRATDMTDISQTLTDETGVRVTVHQLNVSCQTRKLWANGLLIDAKTDGSAVNLTGQPLHVGGTDTNWFADCPIYWIRVYNRALTTEELADSVNWPSTPAQTFNVQVSLPGPTDSIIAEWLPQNYVMNADGSDAVWADSSGNSHNATQSTHALKPTQQGMGYVEWTARKEGAGLWAPAAISNGVPRTVVYKMRVGYVAPTAYPVSFCIADTDSDPRILDFPNGGSWYQRNVDGGIFDITSGTSVLTRDAIAAVVWDAASRTAYLDGVSIGTGQPPAASIRSGQFPLIIGGYAGSGDFNVEFLGRIYWMRVYSRALNADEIAGFNGY